MGVLRTFALTDHGRLYSIRTDERDDEFTASFDLLRDPEYLYGFFSENEHYLHSGPFRGRSIKEAVGETVNEARTLMKELLALDRMDGEAFHQGFDELFETLGRSAYDDPKRKAYGAVRNKRKRTFVRAYALRVDPELYVFTGAAVKLTQKMDEHPWTQKERIKLDQTFDHLREAWGIL